MKLFVPTLCFAAVTSLASTALAQGQLHKCVNAEGKATYTDQPCAVKNGEKNAESNDKAIKKIQAIAQHKDLGKSCWTYGHRAGQCSAIQSSDLRVLFREACAIPAKKFESEQTQDQRRLKKNYAPYEDGDDLDYAHRYTRKSRAVLQCETLDNEMWDFLNQQFPEKISANDRKLIEHQLKLIPNQPKNDREATRYRISISPVN